jgi:kynureninase
MMALYSSLEIFDKAGMTNLVERSRLLTGYLEFLLEKELADKVNLFLTVIEKLLLELSSIIKNNYGR